MKLKDNFLGYLVRKVPPVIIAVAIWTMLAIEVREPLFRLLSENSQLLVHIASFVWNRPPEFINPLFPGVMTTAHFVFPALPAVLLARLWWKYDYVLGRIEYGYWGR